MFNRLIKILSCILILAIIISIAIAPIYSEAIAAPIIIGGTALAIGGLAWAISSAMGVDFSMRNFTSQNIGNSFDPWYTAQSVLNTSDFTFIKGLRVGFDALQLSVNAFNALKAGSKNIIDSNNIPDNTTGTVANNYGIILGLRYNNPWGSGTKTLSSSISIVNSHIGGFYYSRVINNGVTYSIDTTASNRIQDFPNPSIEFSINGNNLLARFVSDNFVDSWENVGSIPSEGPTLPYESNTVDTSFGSTALNNLTVVFPQTVLPSTASLDDILDAINELALANDQNVTVEVDVAPTPTPTPVPIPTTPLGDVPFDQFVDVYGQTVTDAIDNQTDVIDTYGQSVYGELESQTDALDAIGQSIDGIDSTVTSIDTNVASSTGLLGQIKNGVQSLVNSVTGTIANTLSGILTEVQALVDEIVLSTETFVAGLLNTIPTAFQTVWDTMKNAFSIWHYVVEWFTSISSPFTWIWRIASGTSYYIVLPIYATLAGAVVLAFYKRFGK